MKISTTSEIGVVPVVNRASKGAFNKQPLCEKDIPSETSIEFVSVALCVDRAPDMQSSRSWADCSRSRKVKALKIDHLLQKRHSESQSAGDDFSGAV